MIPKLPRLMLIVAACLFTSFSHAQVKTRIFPQGLPAARKAVKKIPVTTLEAPPDLNKLLKAQAGDVPLEYVNRFAVSKQVDIDVLSTAAASEENGFITYDLALAAKGAKNISVDFKSFILPENAVLSIYTRYELTDSITARENNPYKVWATRVYQGDTLSLSLKLPAAEKGLAALKIGQVNFGFKQFGANFYGNPGQSASCNINVVCPEATGWDNERNSVAMIVVNGNESCTGALVMNTCNTNRPFFLTANHCLAAGSVANWVFQFQTWSNTCTGNSGWLEDVQFNGATLRANSAASDFALLELNQVPPANSGIRYSGWNRNATAPAGTVGLHHPAGDLMKFSRDFDLAGVSSWGGTNNHWVSVFEQGTVQPGSSGSPLYDMNHRVVGQLHGDQLNQGNYCAQRRGEYGRLDISWTGGGTNASRLSNWLDPSGSNALTTNTTNVSALTNASLSLSLSGDNLICTGSKTYTLSGVPAGVPVVWTVSNSAMATLTPSGNQVTVNRLGTGDITLTATVGGTCFINNVANKSIHLGPVTDVGITNIQLVPAPYYGIYGEVVTSAPPPYYWYIDGILKKTTTSKQSDVVVAGQCGTQHYFQVGATNGCIGEAKTLPYYFTNSCSFRMRKDTTATDSSEMTITYMGNYNMLLTPNPARNQVVITIPGDTKKGTASAISSIRIIDASGNVQRSVRYGEGSQRRVTLDISSLHSGVYIVEVSDGKNRHTGKLLVQ